MANTRSRVGKNPRAYEGVRSINPPDLIVEERDPREPVSGTVPLDFNHDLGTLWLNKEQQNIWMLVDKVITAGQIKTPTWIQLSAAVSGGIQDLIDNNGLSVVPDAGGSLDVVGNNAVGLTTTRTGPNTLTVTTVSGNPFLISLTGDDSVRVFGDAVDQNIDIIGEDGLVVESFGPHTISIGTESADTIVTSLKDNQNVQALVDSDLAIRLTTAPLNTIRFDATVNPPSDMNLITDTGGEVQLGLKDNASAKVQPDSEGFIRLVAGSNMTILGNAAQNTITFSAASGGTAEGDILIAHRSGDIPNVTGDGQTFTVPFNTIDTNDFAPSAYDTTSGIFTAPVTGNYFITTLVQYTVSDFQGLFVNTTISILGGNELVADRMALLDTIRTRKINGIFRLNQGQTARVRIRTTSGITDNPAQVKVNGNAASTKIMITLLKSL